MIVWGMGTFDSYSKVEHWREEVGIVVDMVDIMGVEDTTITIDGTMVRARTKVVAAAGDI